MPTEEEMVRDTHDELTRRGLITPRFRVDVCPKANLHFPAGQFEHMLRFYAPIEDSELDSHRDVGWCDFVVVDTQEKSVELMVEFEVDTNPKNLTGNFFYPFMAFEYMPLGDTNIYQVDVRKTVSVLLACLEKRGASSREQAALQKGIQVARWLTEVGGLMAGNVSICEIRSCFALAGDDWPRMLDEFSRKVRTLCPHLFAAQP